MNGLKNDIKDDIRRFFETNENENTIQNLWDTGKAVLKVLTLQAYLKKQEKAQINNLIVYLKKLDKEQQTKPKESRRKDIIKIRAEINEIESKKINTKDQ